MSNSSDGSKKLQDQKPKTPNEVFVLENVFQSVADIFAPKRPLLASDTSIIIALDTNVLLLPYQTGKQNLEAIARALDTFAAEERIFVPARVIREFARHRETKFSEMVNALNIAKSKAGESDPLPSILNGVPGFEDLSKEHSDLRTTKSAYAKSLGKMIEAIKAWRGDDPVTQIYRRVFIKERIFEHDSTLTHEEILKNWRQRLSARIPPGYKDSGKDDEGIGDYLVWLGVLEIGKKHKKDMIFITGDGKSDWAIRSDNKPLYPRPELLAEYGQASGGKHIRFASLHEVLEEMEASQEVVADVASLESFVASSSTGAASINIGSFGISTMVRSLDIRTISYDYSRNNGYVTIPNQLSDFVLRFSKASKEQIYFYRDTNSMRRIGRIKGSQPGDLIDIGIHDTTSDHYSIGIEECFYAENTDGMRIVGRVIEIMDDTRGDPEDRVVFRFCMFGPDVSLVAP